MLHDLESLAVELEKLVILPTQDDDVEPLAYFPAWAAEHHCFHIMLRVAVEEFIRVQLGKELGQRGIQCEEVMKLSIDSLIRPGAPPPRRTR